MTKNSSSLVFLYLLLYRSFDLFRVLFANQLILILPAKSSIQSVYDVISMNFWRALCYVTKYLLSEGSDTNKPSNKVAFQYHVLTVREATLSNRRI